MWVSIRTIYVYDFSLKIVFRRENETEWEKWKLFSSSFFLVGNFYFCVIHIKQCAPANMQHILSTEAANVWMKRVKFICRFIETSMLKTHTHTHRRGIYACVWTFLLIEWNANASTRVNKNINSQIVFSTLFQRVVINNSVNPCVWILGAEENVTFNLIKSVHMRR